MYYLVKANLKRGSNAKLKKETFVIIHGIGTGVLKNATAETLKKNKRVNTKTLSTVNNTQKILYLRDGVMV